MDVGAKHGQSQWLAAKITRGHEFHTEFEINHAFFVLAYDNILWTWLISFDNWGGGMDYLTTFMSLQFFSDDGIRFI